MTDQPLHPALARLAVQYDQIVERFARREITALQAREQASVLQARDDNGVHWRLDPDTAMWQYLTVHGDWRNGTPPTYGLVLPTGHDVSGNARSFNPDSRVNLQEIDESVLDGLTGATRRPAAEDDTAAKHRTGRGVKFAIAIVVLVLAALLAAQAFAPTGGSVVAPGDTTSTNGR